MHEAPKAISTYVRVLLPSQLGASFGAQATPGGQAIAIGGVACLVPADLMDLYRIASYLDSYFICMYVPVD